MTIGKDAAGGSVGFEPPARTVEELQEMLERNDRIVVLDIRSTAERAEWSIPGSIHRDAYGALRAGEPTALTDVEIDKDVPVVTVCARGRTSKVAASLLKQRGHDAWTLIGGMKAWSLAWNTAEISSPTATLVQIRRTGKGCLSYMIGSGSDAMVVDASLDPSVYLDLAKQHGWTIRHMLDTHVHADHLSRGRALAERAGATFWLPEQKRVHYPHSVMREGDTLRVGDTSLRALHTPGHTLESASYLVDDRWLLTGDTVFPSDGTIPAAIGRPDLAASVEGARERALLLHATLKRLFALDAGLLVLACHAGAPVRFDHAVIGEPLGTVRAAIRLQESAEAFAEDVLARIPPNPPNHLTIVEYNEAGKLPDGDVTDLEAGANRCAIS